MSVKNKIFLLILLCTTGCNSSDAASDDSIRIQQLKLQLLKRTVDFYLHDNATNPGKKIKIECDSIKNANDLASSCSALIGVSDKIKKFDEQIVTDKQQLENLKTKIVSDVGSKSYRQKMDSYKHFTEEMEKLVAEAPEEPTPAEAAPDANAPVVNPPLTKEIQPASTPEKQEIVMIPETFYWGLNWWNGGAVLLALLSLIVSALLWKYKKRPQKKLPEKSRDHNFSGMTGESINQLINQMRVAGDRIKTLEEQITRIETAQKNMIKAESDRLAQQKKEPEPSLLTAGPKYAKTADNKGFDVSSLSDQPDDKKIFRITFENASRGSFVVTENREAQRFALEDPANYLRGACNYRTTPAYDSKIITEKPGIIELQGNKWAIITPAEIDFV